jgi:hypothetical protein
VDYFVRNETDKDQRRVEELTRDAAIPKGGWRCQGNEVYSIDPEKAEEFDKGSYARGRENCRARRSLSS